MKKTLLILLIIHCSLFIVRAQWIQQNSGTNRNLYDIEFINDKTGWALGDAGIVIKTTNGGMNWMNVPNPSPALSPNLWSVEPIDSNIVYVTSSGDFIMKSTNGGIDWNILHSCSDCNSSTKGIYFLNKDTGWILGANKVFRTYDGGATLDSFYAPWFTNYDIYFKDINTGIFCGDGRVFKTTDGGMNWYDTNVPVQGVFYSFRKLAVVNNYVWVTGSGNPPVYRSTDFCESWEVTDTINNAGIIGLVFINSNLGFAGGGLNKLFKTTNSGYNWYQEYTGTVVVAFISSIEFVNELTGWYASGTGKIFHTTTGGQNLVNILSPETNIPSDFDLLQNYPNPFNSETTIEFRITEDNIYKLEIYDQLGKKLDEPVNKNVKAGIYKFKYNAENLSSGFYIYRLSSKKEFLQKKFILLK